MSRVMDGARLKPTAYRGTVLHALNADTLAFHADGGLLVNNQGLIEACDDWLALEASGRLHHCEMVALPPGHLILPGFVDLHVHLPQLDVTGFQAENLLAWLERYIYPAEARLSDPAYARSVSQRFFEALLRNGTTTAAVFLTSQPETVDISFETAQALGNRVVMGQNLMDMTAPADLIRPAAQTLVETEALCRHWHGMDSGRLQYAWMPRFALTSSEELLAGVGRLRHQYPDVYFHTHLSEQEGEIARVRAQFPWADDYTAVYERFHLLGPKSILAHGVHLSDSELDRIQAAQCTLAHCPGSNFFLKSGRFRLLEILRRGMLLGLGSDVGAGPEISMFQVMKDAQYMQCNSLVSLNTLLYAATLGGAEALAMGDRIGNFLPGKEADFLIVNPLGRPDFGKLKGEEGDTAEALLSRLVYLGDDRMVVGTYIRGRVRAGSPLSKARA